MKRTFTPSEKRLLRGVAPKIAAKRKCSSTYVRQLINGQRNVHTPLAKNIIQDLEHSLLVFGPHKK